MAVRAHTDPVLTEGFFFFFKVQLNLNLVSAQGATVKASLASPPAGSLEGRSSLIVSPPTPL